MTPPTPADALSVRLWRELATCMGDPLTTWVAVAARVFESQVRHARASLHRHLAEPLSEWVGHSTGQSQTIGLALDLLQVAFDFADNIADEQEDRARGKYVTDGYADIPLGVRPCLSAYMVATSRELLEEQFPNNLGLRRAGREVHRILGVMMQGQSLSSSAEKAKLVSGAQARLLCLPLWLGSGVDPVLDERIAKVEHWAQVWGTSWELGYMHEDQPTAESALAWRGALTRARRSWPRFGPFLPGRPLGPGVLLPGIC